MRSNPLGTHGTTHDRCTCTVEVLPKEVDAGAELTLTVRGSCPYGCDLSGQGISIRDHCDAELDRAELTKFDGEAYATNALALRAPLEVGEHTYQAVLIAHDRDGISHKEGTTTFSFVVKPHASTVNVWGLPSVIAAGERFTLKVGAKCSTECNLAGRPLSVFDHKGDQVGTASLGDIWPDTSALYFAEVKVKAPLEPGNYEWRVEAPGSGTGAPHDAGSSTFAVRIVNPPDHEVTVEAFDRETQMPIENAHVLLHPYRTFTDKNGIAKIKVVKGRYALFVSGFRYIAHRQIIDVATDVTTRAELAEEPEGQEDYR